MLEEYKQAPLILVCYHKDISPILSSDAIRPILVGASLLKERANAVIESMSKRLNNASNKEGAILRDDMGENISALNPYFCELTAMYWAWKNVEAEYYGLFHYRRVLDLRAHSEAKAFQAISSSRFNAASYGLTYKHIQDLLMRYDVIVPARYVEELSDKNLYEAYALQHKERDLQQVLELLSAQKEMQEDIEAVFFAMKPPSWHVGNMFIMKARLYEEYCAWLFSLLFAVHKRLDIGKYDSYQQRVYGFLAERLFNVWLAYKRRTSGVCILEAPLLYLKSKKPFIGWDNNAKYRRFYFLGARLYKSPR